MAQAVRRRPLTVDARVKSQASTCDICGGQNGTVNIISLMFHAHLCTHYRRYVSLASESVLINDPAQLKNSEVRLASL
jgi:hypothetical protein